MRISDDDVIKACAAGELIWDRDAVTYRVRGEDVGLSLLGVWRYPSKIRFPVASDNVRQVRMVLAAAGRQRLAELEPEILTHEVTVNPSEPGLVDWKCSCGEASGYHYASFGRAADAASDHVPDDQGLTVTRPSLPEGDRG